MTSAHLTAFSIFVGSYAVLLLFLTRENVLLWSERHKRLSFKAGFNGLCWIWALLRCTFWSLMIAYGETMPHIVEYGLLWLPQTVQFAVFSLLALFFLKVINFSTWQSIRRSWYIGAAAANIVFTSLVVIFAILISLPDNTDEQANAIQNAELVANGCIFLLLSCLFAKLGRALWHLEHKNYSRMFLLEQRTVGMVNLTLFVIFTCRSVFNILSASNAVDLPISAGSVGTEVGVVVLYELWEICPTVLLLFTIAGPRRGRKPTALPDYGLFRALKNTAGGDPDVNFMSSGDNSSDDGGTGASRGIPDAATPLILSDASGRFSVSGFEHEHYEQEDVDAERDYAGTYDSAGADRPSHLTASGESATLDPERPGRDIATSGSSGFSSIEEQHATGRPLLHPSTSGRTRLPAAAETGFFSDRNRYDTPPSHGVWGDAGSGPE